MNFPLKCRTSLVFKVIFCAKNSLRTNLLSPDSTLLTASNHPSAILRFRSGQAAQGDIRAKKFIGSQLETRDKRLQTFKTPGCAQSPFVSFRVTFVQKS